jgi:DNA-binding MarR family transcriptional regulator
MSTPATTPVLDLERYLPGFITWISNKLSRGASQHYLNVFGIGIEVWRCLVLLALESSISAQRVSRITGMDKSSVSRCFKSMQVGGLIMLALADGDGRLRIAKLTAKGRKLHDQIIGIALERERVLIEVLDPSEREVLIGLMRRLHENLPAVEEATERYVARHFPRAGQRMGRARSLRPARSAGATG